MMEGVASEAASLAGHLGLSNLCWIYDKNKITIEGHTASAFSEDVATRFIAYGWNVTRVGDANDLEMLNRAFERFHTEGERPTLIIVDSHIGYGAPHKQDTSGAHGAPLGADVPRAARGRRCSPSTAGAIPTSQSSSLRSSAGSFRRAGTRTFPRTPRTPRVWRGARPLGKC